MRARRVNGFTLVEILIVVVILGILAAIVVPQFTSASQEAVKGALSSQLQTISSQIELYRVQHFGNLPAIGGAEGDNIEPMPEGTGDHNGWTVLVEENYLKSEPNNGFTRSTSVAAGDWVDSPATDGTADGWAFNAVTGDILANGFNQLANLLANEEGFDEAMPPDEEE